MKKIKILLLRHGDVLEYPNHDKLTKTAQEFAKVYPKKFLRYKIKTIYYNNTNNKRKNINRCGKTVKHFNSIKKEAFGSKKECIYKVVNNITETSLICYRVGSLKYFPKIENFRYNEYLYDYQAKQKGKPWKKWDKDSLYEKIFVLEKNKERLSHIETICTGTYKGDKSRG